MCGIFCEITYPGHVKIKDHEIFHRIESRGPDCIHSSYHLVENSIQIYFFGAVLWMQGPSPTKQPIVNDQGILVFNGDIFNETWNNSVSDTQIIMNILSDCNSSDGQIMKVLQSLQGPFSLVYYDKVSCNLYFSRDRIGRTTLLCYKDEFSLVLASVLGRKYKCIEVPATHLYKLNVKTNELSLYSWENPSEVAQVYYMEKWIQIVQEQQSLPDDKFACEFNNLDLNYEDDIIKQIETIAQQGTCKLTIMRKLLENDTLKRTVQEITDLLERSIKIRLSKQPGKCKKCINDTAAICNHCTVGVLFSGGLDCTILAYLADKYVPKNQPIDLINVAFKNSENATYDVPDRVTGKQSLKELKQRSPSRQWVFREINVPKEKLEYYQANTIGDLVYPRFTILDESLGSALWFAASGRDDKDVSSCRILLVGSGADELFGGYVRHRNALKRHGWVGLSKELLLDWSRISFRNLARDNRVICDHGRQPRMPYLDEKFTDYVLKLKPWIKCFPTENLQCGIGDKLILRLVAFNLGLTDVATLPKRALQFGSKIANKKEKGSDISKTFINI